MRRILRHRPSPALVVACLALAVALSGVGYAAVVIPRNSVGTAQLKTDAVVSKKVKNGSLLAADFKAGQLPAGAPGAKGDKGDKGDTGEAGPFPDPLQSGKTLRGRYFFVNQAGGAGELAAEGISFGFTLASAPTAHFIAAGAAAPAACPGNATTPAAQAGHLCVYAEVDLNTSPSLTEVSRYGFDTRGTSTAAGQYGSRGQWAVTAP
jgi:hypothetical protein